MTLPDCTLPATPRYLLLRPVSGLSMIAAVLIAATTAVGVAVAWSTWNGYFLAERYIGDDLTVGMSDLLDSDERTSALGWGYIAALVVSGVAFVAWLYRARWNAEILCDAKHRRTQGWIAGSWICPIVNLWFPFQVVSDIWKASKPDTPRQLDSLSLVRGSGALALWWGCWVSSIVIDRIAVAALFDENDPTLESFRAVAIAETVSLVLVAVAGALIIIVMRQIARHQEQRRT